MSGRYTLTIEYDEPNPAFVPPAHDPYAWGGQDRRTPLQQQERLNRRTLSVELTYEQWNAIRRAVLEVS